MTSSKCQVLTYNGHKIYLVCGNYDSNNITIFKNFYSNGVNSGTTQFVP